MKRRNTFRAALALLLILTLCMPAAASGFTEKLIAITLVNSDHAAADLRVLYDSEENVIRDTNTIYHKQ